MSARQPPGLLLRTLAVTFVTSVLLLVVIFVTVTMSAREQVRQTVSESLEASQRMFAAMHNREQHDLRRQAVTVAESPTLKAAMDTYGAESFSAPAVRAQLLNTIKGELAKLAARVEADAIVVADARQTTLAAAGQFASAFPPHEPMPVESDQSSGDAIDGVAHVGAETFRLVGAPLLLSDGTEIGTLYLATSLDRQYAQQLGDIARTNIAIVSDGTLVATTLQADTQRQFSAVAARLTDEGTVDLGGSSHAFRRLFRIADTSFYALDVDRRFRAGRGRPDDARADVHRDWRARPGAARQHLDRAPAEQANRPAVRLAPHDGDLAPVRQAPRADRIQRGARRPDRDVQRADGVGRGGGSGNRSRVHRGHSCAGRGARRARPVHRRSLGARERRVGGDRPRVESAAPTISRCSGSAPCSTTSARSACPTRC